MLYNGTAHAPCKDEGGTARAPSISPKDANHGHNMSAAANTQRKRATEFLAHSKLQERARRNTPGSNRT